MTVARMLPPETLEQVQTWGQTFGSLNYVQRPSTIAELKATFELARQTGRSVGMRGSGLSYGDAALNAENILLDLRRLNRILAWDPARGVITMEPGVTIAQLWRYILPDGWWPPVMPGTMFPTIGGALAMNIHGKNQWKTGALGDHILAFDVLLPGGDILHCTKTENADLFYSVIGSFGMLGCFTSITLQLKKIYSGKVNVTTFYEPNLHALLQHIEQLKDSSDYLIGWIDCFAGKQQLGRGQLQMLSELPPGADANMHQTLLPEYQEPPNEIFGIIPRSILWRFVKLFVNDWGMRLVSTANFWSGKLQHGKSKLESYVTANFLLDYVPNWKNAYLPGGLIQHQSFVPTEQAEPIFREILTLCQKAGLPAYLAVLKRYRPDNFLVSCNIDGFSLALDFRVTKRNRKKLLTLLRQLDDLVVNAGGRFYFAKDSTLHPDTVETYLGEATLQKLRALKKRCDPENLLQSNLSRRLFAQIFENTTS
jgi:decaprenylphospho-beta-D-ribofuranose 2-oxidase